MGEFDLSLIREFRSRPAFYDRNSPRFRDKVYTAHEWQEISNKLGYDVSLLKDRMLQLRNRYNLEKRRLEQLREENPDQMIVSPWPLYDELQFLSEHIRARRSYKTMSTIHASTSLADLSNSESNPSTSNATIQPAFAANGLVAVKMETEEDEGEGDNEDTDPESESQSGAENTAINPAHAAAVNNTDAGLAQLKNSHLHSTNGATAAAGNSHHNYMMLPAHLQPSISIRHMDALRTATAAAPSSQPSSRKRAARMGKSGKPSETHDNFLDYSEIKQRCLSAREQKYVAFGKFMFSSLLELPQQKALLLVEKFTSELVKVFIQKNDGQDAQSAATTAATTVAQPTENRH